MATGCWLALCPTYEREFSTLRPQDEDEGHLIEILNHFILGYCCTSDLGPEGPELASIMALGVITDL